MATVRLVGVVADQQYAWPGPFPQIRILNNRVSTSSSENTVNVNGIRGAAVAAASRATSVMPKGTMRISLTTE